LTGLVDADYSNAISIVRKEWDEFEKTAFRLQPEIESTALELYRSDKAIALEFLTNYSNRLAVRSFEAAKRLIREMPPSPGYYAQWGRFHFGAGDLGAALENFDKAIEIDPDFPGPQRCREWVSDEIRARTVPVDLSPETMSALTGDYGSTHVFRENGRLCLRRGSGADHLLRPISKHVFAFEKPWRYRVRFVTNESGDIEKLVLYSLDGWSEENVREEGVRR
jgi:hypothetical protein